MGGAGQRSIANFLGSDLIPLRKSGIVQGMANLFHGSGAMLGGVFGGVLNDHTALGWRLAFLIQVPLAVLHRHSIPPENTWFNSFLLRPLGYCRLL